MGEDRRSLGNVQTSRVGLTFRLGSAWLKPISVRYAAWQLCDLCHAQCCRLCYKCRRIVMKRCAGICRSRHNTERCPCHRTKDATHGRTRPAGRSSCLGSRIDPTAAPFSHRESTQLVRHRFPSPAQQAARWHPTPCRGSNAWHGPPARPIAVAPPCRRRTSRSAAGAVAPQRSWPFTRRIVTGRTVTRRPHDQPHRRSRRSYARPRAVVPTVTPPAVSLAQVASNTNNIAKHTSLATTFRPTIRFVVAGRTCCSCSSPPPEPHCSWPPPRKSPPCCICSRSPFWPCAATRISCLRFASAKATRGRATGCITEPVASPTSADTLVSGLGAIAQLVERFVRNEEVRSSILLSSTPG